MNSSSLFGEYWSRFASRPVRERREYFDSLSKSEQAALLASFYQEQWPALFFRNMLDEVLHQIRSDFGIDLIDLRLKAIRDGRVFLIDRDIWERVETLTGEYDGHVDTTFIFGGLKVRSWGKNRQFCCIRAQKRR